MIPLRSSWQWILAAGRIETKNKRSHLMAHGTPSASRDNALAKIPVVLVGDAVPTKARSIAPPARSAAEPYAAYKPRPFTREERDNVTVLFGGLHWRAERVIQGAMENL